MEVKHETKILGTMLPGRFTKSTGIFVQNEEYKVGSHYEGNFFEYLDFCKQQRRACVSVGDNHNKFNYHIFDKGGDSWTGGSYHDLIMPVTDFSMFNEHLKNLSSNKVWKKVAQSFEQASVRKRVRSEHDGEFDFDKKYDVQPFQQRSRRLAPTRIVRMKVHADFSCGVDASTINKYGSFATAVINLLEKNHTMVEVYACYAGAAFVEGNSSSYMSAQLKVKSADEYLPISQLLKVFSTTWYRRAVFGLITASAENVGGQVSTGLGRPIQYGTCWETKGNELSIYSVPDHEQQYKIIEKLTELVGVTN